MTEVILGIGTNRGNRLAHLRQAVRALSLLSPRLHLRKISGIYESDAMLPENAPQSWDQPFLNLCVLGETDLPPQALLDSVKKIEATLGRKTGERWAPREIDIDILTMGALVFKATGSARDLKIPHPGLLDRPFALLPLAEIAPDWRCPAGTPCAGQTARETAARWLFEDPATLPFHTRKTRLFLTELVGILNVTPDSFSDGGACSTPEQALFQIQKLLLDGATVLDLGAESTRPHATPVSPEEEWKRLAPVLERISELPLQEARLSVDTRHPSVAQRALEQGAHWINDVSGGEAPEMIRVLADSEADYVFMHSLCVPPRQDVHLPFGKDPMGELLSWGEAKIAFLQKAGIPRSRLIFDPGIGFGKTLEQTLRILGEAHRFRDLGVRLLVGHSRKTFLNPAQSPVGRDLETAVISGSLAAQGVDYIRVHDVTMNSRAIQARLG